MKLLRIWGSDNITRELVPAIDHPIAKKVMSGSSPTVPYIEFELVTSGHRVVTSWQQILIYAIVSMHILETYHVMSPCARLYLRLGMFICSSLFIGQFMYVRPLLFLRLMVL